MKKTRTLIAIATGLLLMAGSGYVEARQLRFKGTAAGTFLGTRIDGNDDGVAVDWSTAELRDRRGRSTSQTVTEVVPTGPTPACPGGVFIIDAQNSLGSGTGTTTFPNGDQIFTQILTRTTCLDAVGNATGSDTGSIVGGTGRFTGASGTFTQSFTGFFQRFDFDAVPPQGFGSFRGEYEGTLNLP